MLKKPIRTKQISNQDKKQPQTISELIRRYDLDNTKIYDYLDYLIEEINNKQAKIIQQNETATEMNVYSAKAIDNKLAKESKLVAEIVLKEVSNIMEIANLDIVKDGGVYDIVIAEYDTVNSGAGHVLQINNKTTNYINTHRYTNSNNVELVGNGSNCLAYANGFNMETNLFYTVGTLIFFDKNWIAFESSGGSSNVGGTNKISITQSGYALKTEINNINSIRVVANEGTFIGPGSFMKVYKR